MPEMNIAAVVLHYHREEDTLDAVRSLQASKLPVSITVVDNFGSDSLRASLNQVAAQAVYLRSPRNLGFAGGMNLGIRHRLGERPDYFFPLTEDTIVEPDTLGKLARVAQLDSRVGIVGPGVYYAWDVARINYFGARLAGRVPVMRAYWPAVDKPPEGLDAVDLDAVCGCSLISRSVVEAIGCFDESYFMYYEDIDFCVRARRAGFRILGVPSARLLHKARAGAAARLRERVEYSARSRVMFYWRLLEARPRFYFALYLAMSTTIFLTRSLLARDTSAARKYLTATVAGLKVIRRGWPVPRPELAR